MRVLRFDVPLRYDGEKLHTYLKREQGFSSRLITSLKHDEDGIQLNGAHARTIDRLRVGDVITVHMHEPANPIVPSACSVPILYEDEDIIVYNKPPAMACHPAKNHQEDTLANVHAAHMGEGGGTFRALGRLDKDTSGAVLVAKNMHAAAILTDNPVYKSYLAIACGRVEPAFLVIEQPIIRPDPMRTERWVGEGGQWARTDCTVLHRMNNYTFLRLNLHSGRTHQIRVHMAFSGHPLAGDDMYGGDLALIGRQALHCEWLSFAHPLTGHWMRLQAPMPRDMQLARYRIGFLSQLD